MLSTTLTLKDASPIYVSVDATVLRSTSGSVGTVWNYVIAQLLAKTAFVIDSGAGPPFGVLNLMPKSSSGPPGL